VLDLGRPEVADYLFDALAKLLEDLPITYLKWDHNRDLAPAGGCDGRASYHRQVHGAYGLFDRIRAAFPAVEIEACAGGGGRIDAGIIRRTHRFWTSDCIDAVSRVAMQAGFLTFMPPETMGAHIGASPAHSTGRMQSLDFRAAVALQGHLGVECDLVKMKEDERQRLAQWIAFYKRWRGLLHAEIWQQEAEDSLHWHAAGNDREWLLIVYRLAPTSWRHAPQLRLPFVRGDRAYSIAMVAPEGNDAPTRYHGDWLHSAGLTLPPMPAEAAVLFHVRESI
jgi:alpha-galactosidase